MKDLICHADGFRFCPVYGEPLWNSERRSSMIGSEF